MELKRRRSLPVLPERRRVARRGPAPSSSSTRAGTPVSWLASTPVGLIPSAISRKRCPAAGKMLDLQRRRSIKNRTTFGAQLRQRLPSLACV